MGPGKNLYVRGHKLDVKGGVGTCKCGAWQETGTRDYLKEKYTLHLREQLPIKRQREPQPEDACKCGHNRGQHRKGRFCLEDCDCEQFECPNKGRLMPSEKGEQDATCNNCGEYLVYKVGQSPYHV